jgi:hypothetical protein
MSSSIINIYKKEQLNKTWKDGSTMWVVTGKDGFHVFHKDNITDKKQLNELMKPFLESIKQDKTSYTIHTNRI